MKVGIIVYSESGHTLSVAKKIEQNLEDLKHDVTLEEVKVVRHNKSDRADFQLTHEPQIKDYDLLIMGSFVEGFRLTPVMNQYLSKQTFNKQKVIFFLTHYFPFPWMGGTQTINEVTSLLATKDVTLSKKGIINWSRQKEKTIDEFISEIKDYVNRQ